MAFFVVRRDLSSVSPELHIDQRDLASACLQLKAQGKRSFRRFPAHNKYTADDWRWLLGRAGFAIGHEAQRPSHRILLTTATVGSRGGADSQLVPSPRSS